MTVGSGTKKGAEAGGGGGKGSSALSTFCLFFCRGL